MLGRVLDEAAAKDQLLRSGGDRLPGQDVLAAVPNEGSALLNDMPTGSRQEQQQQQLPADHAAGSSANESRSNKKSIGNNNNNNYGSTTTITTSGAAGAGSVSSTITPPATRSRGNSGVDSTLASDYELDDDEEDDDDDDDEETLEDFLDDDDDHQKGFCHQCWNCLRFLADVENVWDSPNEMHHHGNHHHASRHHRRKQNLLLAFWFLMLAASYAGERSTFKFLVDQAGPFRLFSVEIITAIHALLLGGGLLVAWFWHRQRLEEQQRRTGGGGGPAEPLGTPFELPLGLPVVDVGLMALLDVVGLMLVFLTGIYVSPTNTVILVQFVLPLMAFLMQFVHPQGRCAVCRTSGDSVATSATSPLSPDTPPGSSHHQRNNSRTSNYSSGSGYSQSPEVDSYGHNQHHMHNNNNNNNNNPIPNCAGLAVNHLTGAALIFFACALALIPSFYTIIDPDFFRYADSIPLRVAYNTLFFLSSCIPAAASQLYKEHVFLQYKQPVNVHKVNLLLSIFQFVFVSVLSPLVFTLQGLGSEDAIWYTLYPSSEFSKNFVDGLSCFFWQLDEEDQLAKYPEKANCDFVLLFSIIHAFCIIMVGIAVDKLVSAGSTKMTHRGISAGIILAVVGMAIYDFRIPQFSYGPFVDGLNLLCVIMIIMGSEVYHRVNMPDTTFTTVYPSLDNIYEDD